MNKMMEYMLLQRLVANAGDASVKQFNPKNKLFTKHSFDTKIGGLTYTVEAYKITNRDHYYANIMCEGMPVQKIGPKSRGIAGVARDLYMAAARAR